jgi:methyl-accepting chemotaxis protein
MMIKSKGISLASRGLRYKLKVAVSLMAILPLLVCVYIVSSYVLPLVGLKVEVTASVAMVVVSIAIAVIGFTVVKEVFDHVLAVSTEAKLIAAGDLSRKVEVPHEDELGDLGDALNQMTVRIRSNMDELKSYSERTTEINLEIQKRVIVLSSLLQISSLISQGARLDDILKITVEKARLLANSEMAFLLFREESSDTFFCQGYGRPESPASE